MERSEPALVPEWLRSTGGVIGGGSSIHHNVSSSSHSDGLLSAHNTRSRTSRSISDLDSPRAAFLDRSSSSNSRWSSSSNGSAKHAYSSFSRGNREREKERSGFGDHWDRDGFDPFGNILIGRGEKDALRRSHSMASRKQSEMLPRRVAVDSKNVGQSNHSNGNGVHSGSSIGSSTKKAVFDKEFPSLGTEDRQAVPDLIRVSSPGLSTAVQSLPVGNSALIGGEGWTSALVEVPNIIGSGSMGLPSVQQAVVAASGSGASSTMAEAVAQAPSRARTAPQLSVKTQRLEELAIKQSRQLIPVTPPMPKTSVLSLDKSKPKTAVRTSEMIAAAKSGQQQPSSLQLANQPLRGGHVKSDVSKSSQGKFQVLKPVWENGVSPTPKDVTSPTNASSKVGNSPLAFAPPVASAPLWSPKNSKPSTVEKRPSSQAQSRNDFFNLMRKKSMNTNTAQPDASQSPTMEKPGEATKEVVRAPVSPVENGGEVTSNGDSCGEGQKFFDSGEKDLNPDVAVYPNEEEAAFLRSLGWEENAGDDEGLTEEEINAFYQEVMKLRPSLKLCRGMELKLSILSMLPDSHATNMGGASSEFTSSDSGSET